MLTPFSLRELAVPTTIVPSWSMDSENLELSRLVFFVSVVPCPELHGVPVTLGRLGLPPVLIRVFIPVVSQETGVPRGWIAGGDHGPGVGVRG